MAAVIRPHKIGLIFAVFILTTGMARAQDADGHFGPWTRLNPSFPGLQGRASCDDVGTEFKGRQTSQWRFQIRSRYKDEKDFLWEMVAAVDTVGKNTKLGPFLASISPRAAFENGGLLWGSCSQNGHLLIGVSCLADKGTMSSAACFREFAGKNIEQRDFGKPVPIDSSSGNSNTQAAGALHWCVWGGWQGGDFAIFYTRAFQDKRDDSVLAKEWWNWLGQHSYTEGRDTRPGDEARCESSGNRQLAEGAVQGNATAHGSREVAWPVKR